MKTRQLAPIAAICLLLVAMLPTTGCAPQATIAALTSTLGNAASSIASLEGNATLAAQLKTDTTAAVAAINNWKSGTPAQNVVQALNIVINDLNLICPSICGPYEPLIVLALGTVQSIIAIVDPSATPAAAKVGPNARVRLGTPAPKDAKAFVAAWNGICASDPALAHATIQ
ncbi:MAG: hypothetical protein WA627_15985 [Candidatus Sulfotelmatobacter sp.]